MPNMQGYECKLCYAPIDPKEIKNGVVRCKFCGHTFTIAKPESKAASFLAIGEHSLDTAKFDEAYSAFKKAAELDAEEPEAYFGMALAEFKVQYLKALSEKEGKTETILQPIVHETSVKKFADSKNVQKALELATPEQCKIYVERAEEIDYINEEFMELQKSGLDYDCFICVKVTDDETKERTKDYKAADDIYFDLREKGYKPFFSEREIGDKTGKDYEALILYAIYSSECMLVVCSDESYLNTKWVKNEYTRFLKLVRDEEKESDSIALAFGGKPIEKLPGKNGKIQGIDLRAFNAHERVLKFVETHTPEAKRRREEEIKRKAKEEEERKRRLAEQEARLESQARQLEEQRKIIEELRTQKNSSFSSPEELLEMLERAREERERKAKEEKNRKLEEARKAQEQAAKKAEEERIAKETAAKKEAERLAKEQAEQKAAQERKAKEEAARKAESERAAKLAAEQKAKAEAEKKAKLEAENKAQAEKQKTVTAMPVKPQTNPSDFEIKDGILVKYNGNGGDVVIPEGVTKIEHHVFAGITTIKDIVIPEGVTVIGAYAFNACLSLEKIKIPKSVKSVYGCAFLGCNSLKRVDIDDLSAWCKIDFVDSGANPVNCAKMFVKGNELADLVIPDNIAKIKQYAFCNCKSIKSVTISTIVSEISSYAFLGCTALEKITVVGSNTYFVSKNNCVLTSDRKTLVLGCKTSEIPDGITKVSEKALYGCHLKNSVLPDSLVEIGFESFGVNDFTDLIIPNGVKRICGNAFSQCNKLKTLTIPSGVNEIGYHAFVYCTELENVTIPKTFKNEKEEIFGFDSPLSKPYHAKFKFTVPTKNDNNYVVENGVLLQYNGKGGAIVIPDGVTSIGENAFRDNEDIKSVVIPSFVKEIGDYAFLNCTRLSSVTIENGVKKIGASVFFNCNRLHSLVIPQSVTSFDTAVLYASGLKKVTLPKKFQSEIENHLNLKYAKIKFIYT